MALRESDPAEVGGYRIEDRLGSGGMGVVYLARSASGRRLAVKVVHAQYADDDEFRIRFSREVAAARQVSGAFTAPVVDADADGSRPWMATLYIPGEDLGTHVRRHGPLSVDRLRELAAGLAEALRDIHRAGVVHRDLKPANVMLAEDGPRVIDFGISRAAEFGPSDVLTQTGRVMGTPPFMSPEQFSSPHDVGPAADIFSLGAVLVYAATRRGPFDSSNPWETATRVVEGTPDLDGVPQELLPFVRFCLEKHPKSRPTPDELLTLLRDGRLPAPGPRSASGDAAGPKRPRGRRHRWWLVSGAVAAVLAVAGTTFAVSRQGHGTPDALPAGWRPWHQQSRVPSPHDPDALPSGSFSRCVAAGPSLVCAGDSIMATRFDLARGRNTWALPVDSTPGGSSAGSGGTIIGTRGDTVYVWGVDDRTAATDRDATRTRYSVQALSARTGKALWKTVTGEGEVLTGGEEGYAVPTPRGVIAVYGDKGQSYALLGASDGKIRWKRPMRYSAANDKGACQLGGAAGRVYMLCGAFGKDYSLSATTVTELDPATGRSRWSVTAKGALSVLGQAGEHLVLADGMGTLRTLTLVHVPSHVVTTVRLSRPEAAVSGAYLERGILYCTFTSGSVHAFSPRTGRLLWRSNSTVEQPGPPTATSTRLYLASPTGRLAALDLRTGRVRATRPGRDDGGTSDSTGPASTPLVLVGDALYVPYGIRSVFTVNIRHL
ncbi:protein kinase domain-containing protein [Streptomyces olivochromogenes]|uniref:serine/threonine-protein kinase n=1 Tax=Streptomyces olivochromogenes TaxID=1963 RepID=UPI001F1C9F1F|nr:serine/threonine-protein kinase [Streptomyces olivochromogenes]MCF3130847.1 PQQ-binding-like beta-propeller repeat protein [Streptomyces olivochromogenes]